MQPQLSKFPMLKAMVYFDSPNAPLGNTSVEDNPQVMSAYKSLTASITRVHFSVG